MQFGERSRFQILRSTNVLFSAKKVSYADQHKMVIVMRFKSTIPLLLGLVYLSSCAADVRKESAGRLASGKESIIPAINSDSNKDGARATDLPASEDNDMPVALRLTDDERKLVEEGDDYFFALDGVEVHEIDFSNDQVYKELKLISKKDTTITELDCGVLDCRRVDEYTVSLDATGFPHGMAEFIKIKTSDEVTHVISWFLHPHPKWIKSVLDNMRAQTQAKMRAYKKKMEQEIYWARRRYKLPT